MNIRQRMIHFIPVHARIAFWLLCTPFLFPLPFLFLRGRDTRWRLFLAGVTEVVERDLPTVGVSYHIEGVGQILADRPGWAGDYIYRRRLVPLGASGEHRQLVGR